MTWKTSRVTTSKMTERFSLRIVRPPCSHVPRPGVARRQRLGRSRADSRVLRVRTKIEARDAGRGRHEHRHLAEGVPGADVDERDVDDVLAVAELVGLRGEPGRHGLGAAAAGRDERDRADGRADGHTERDAPRARGRVRVAGELRRQPAQREDEDDERHRLDEHLGDGEVGRAVQDEEQRDAVAGGADEHDRGESAARDEHEHGGRDDDDPDDGLRRGCPRAGPSGQRAADDAADTGQGDEDDEDGGEVDRAASRAA